MRAGILLHEDVALADIKGALLHLCHTMRKLYLAQLHTETVFFIMLGGIFSVCRVSIVT